MATAEDGGGGEDDDDYYEDDDDKDCPANRSTDDLRSKTTIKYSIEQLCPMFCSIRTGQEKYFIFDWRTSHFFLGFSLFF